MAGIFGIFLRNDAGRAMRSRLDAIGRALRGAPTYADDDVMLWGKGDSTSNSGCPIRIVSSATIHNHAELAGALGSSHAPRDDCAMLQRAFARWHEAACGRIHGDWSVARWDPDARSLLLARDPYGHSALYHQCDPAVFAFATGLEELRALALAPPVLDEQYLGQMLISWPAYHGSRTIDRSVTRLPPAHRLHVDAKRVDTDCYWRMEDVPDLRLRRRVEYLEQFRDLFDQAVRERIPEQGNVATTLSSGLDSGAVAVTTAPLLAASGRRTTAYVSVPAHDSFAFGGSALTDEYPLAAVTAASSSTIDLRRVDAAGISPIAAMREMLAITHEPEHAAASCYWILELFRTAARDGNGTILTGQMGNGGMSWTGVITSWPLRTQVAHYGISDLVRFQLRRMLPAQLDTRYRVARARGAFLNSAIREDLARQLDLRRQRARDPLAATTASSRQQRLRFIRPGTSRLGAFYAQLAAATGIAIADPTADPRLLQFCLSIPDKIFVDPETGADRWLTREGMNGRLPDAVRLNALRGRQSSDIVLRLRQFRDEVEAALDEIASGPGAAFVDVVRMRAAWRRIQVEDGPHVYHLAVTMLSRGIMAGLFVNGFGTRY